MSLSSCVQVQEEACYKQLAMHVQTIWFKLMITP
jgi:hypothetical protein